ncbi:MAG: hypothetical protein WCF67_06595 [Chitinophagaceae bacterium]
MRSRSHFLLVSILIFFAWLACAYKLYIDYDKESISTNVIHAIFIIIAGIISIVAFINDYVHYSDERKLFSFFPTGISVACITGLLLTVYFLKKQDDTPTILYAQKNYQVLSSISIDLRKNNTYKIGRHQFMSTTYTRGIFKRSDSLIYLDRSGIPDELISDRLILLSIPENDSARKYRPYNLFNIIFGAQQHDTTPGKYLYQLDRHGRIMDSAISFKIIPKIN